MRLKPMLCTEVSADDLEDYIEDDKYWLGQKLDGVRVLMEVANGVATPLGRDGRPKANWVPAPILRQFAAMTVGTWFFDGELVDNRLWLFDVPMVDDKIKPDDPYSMRYLALQDFFTGWSPDPCVRLLTTGRTRREKRKRVERLHRGKAEGVVLRHVDGPYLPGKRSKHMLKAKWTHEVDAVVTVVSVDGKANCAFAVVSDGKLVEIGRCSTIGKPSVKIGDVITVRYLYAVNPQEPRVVQPRMIRRRDDKAPIECTIDQLHYTDKHTIH